MDSSPGRFLIPAAGGSARFAAHGHATPKSLLPISVAGVQMTALDRILLTVPRFWRPLVVCRREHADLFSEHLGHRGDLVVLDSPTQGQSETILRGLEHVDPLDQVIVHNCDLVIGSHHIRQMVARRISSVLVHHEMDPAFSYVQTTPASYGSVAVRFAEKQPISGLAQTGVWMFRYAFSLVRAIREQMDRGLRYAGNGEFYLSEALNLMHDPILVLEIDRSDWLDLGTPEAIAAQGGQIG